MLRKNYFIFLAAIALFLISSSAVFAQTSPVRGRVMLQKADGTTVPVAGAVVDVYRTDAKGKPPAGKTDKKGNFSFAGLMLGQTFAFSISGPGIQAQVFPNNKAGQDDRVFTVYEGDGKPYTEEEARAALSAPKKQPAANTTTTSTTTAQTDNSAQQQQPQQQQATPEQIAAAKKAQEEYNKQVAEVTSKNEKIKNANEIINKALTEGRTAFEAKNYDLAISKFDEGINADPDFAGTAPVLLNNKTVALMRRGTDKYNVAAKGDPTAKAAAMESVKKDFLDGITASNRAVTLIKNNPAPDSAAQKNYDSNKYAALSDLIELHRLLILTKADTSMTKDAVVAYQEYMTVEPDAAKKVKAQTTLADILREAGDSDNAIAAYRKVLEMSPDSADAMAGLGLSLFNSGIVNNNTAQKQEGLNFMQRFADSAPDTHPLKASVKEAVEYLKTNDKLTPQKVAKPAAAGKKKT